MSSESTWRQLALRPCRRSAGGASVSPASQRAVYEGRLALAAPADIAVFVAGCRHAFGVLTLVCLLGIGVALLSGHAARARRAGQPG